MNDDRITATLAGPPYDPYTLEHAYEYIARAQNKTYRGTKKIWAIRNGADELIGAINIRPSDDEDPHVTIIKPKSEEREADFGFWLHPDYRGSGIMTEVLRTMIDQLGIPWGFKVYIGSSMKDNWASRRTFEKCGFKFIREELQAMEKLTTKEKFDLWYYKLVIE
ncbi:hypothetical protein TRVA0_011S01750 [Trichomonascus vanleenenianus]|uniref:GNAT family N-acetyltransferase n=1 Tax=Trichomonascus vanleenenianus TaxID=2268995 RepID=UPI003ECB885C